MSDWEIASEAVRILLIMSLSGSAVALLLFILKPIIRNKLPKSAQYYLWLVVIAVYLVPFSCFVKVPTNNITIPSISEIVHENVVTGYEYQEQEMLRRTGHSGQLSRKDFAQMSSEELKRTADVFAETDKTRIFLNWLLFSIPIIGFINVFIGIIAENGRFIRKIKKSNTSAEARDIEVLKELCKDSGAPRLYRNTSASTPLLIGLYRPMIVLPDREYTDAQLRFVLLHELIHYHRKDIVIKCLSAIACAVHWYNPIAWFVRRKINRACELACDEAVIRSLDAEGKQNYGDTLIYVATDSKTPHTVLSTTMCEEKKALKERLHSIMKSRKHTRIATAVSVLLIAVAILAACVLGASAERAQESIPSVVAETQDIHEEAREIADEQIARPHTVFADRTAVESEWATASSELRMRQVESAYFEADRLCYVESVNETDLEAYTIFRVENESGGFEPYVMLSSEDDPIHTIIIRPNAQIELLYFQQDSADTESAPGLLEDVVPGSIISAWGAFSESAWAFIAERIVVWTIVGDVIIPNENYVVPTEDFFPNRLTVIEEKARRCVEMYMQLITDGDTTELARFLLIDGGVTDEYVRIAEQVIEYYTPYDLMQASVKSVELIEEFMGNPSRYAVTVHDGRGDELVIYVGYGDSLVGIDTLHLFPSN